MATNAERIAAARSEAERSVLSDTVILIHPFDMTMLLNNPMTSDAIIVHIDGIQYMVVDGATYSQTTQVKNKTTITQIMQLGHKQEPSPDDQVS